VALPVVMALPVAMLFLADVVIENGLCFVFSVLGT